MIAEAAAELGQVVPAERTMTEYLEVYGALLQEQQDWSTLQTVARELCQRLPENPSWWVMYAYATRRASSLGEAEEILIQAEKAHPKEAVILFNLGCYACQRGDLDLARSRVAQASALDPRFEELAAHDPDLEPLRRDQPRP